MSFDHRASGLYAIASPRPRLVRAQRKPASALSPTARAEVDYVLARLARHDRRAAL